MTPFARALTALALAPTLLPQPVAAKSEPELLYPISAWNLNYGDERCSLIRAFGTENAPVTILLERYGPSNGASMAILGKRFRTDSLRVTTRVWFGEGKPTEGKAITATLGEARTPMLIVGPVSIIPDERLLATHGKTEADDARSITDLTFQMVPMRPVALKVGRMDQPLHAMEKCTDSLMQSWGLDPAVQHHLSRGAQPAGAPAKWITSSDYPYTPLIEGESGVVRFRLLVGPDGVPTSCVVQTKTSPDSFADITCRLLQKRARFTPALDANGKPVASFYLNTVSWINGG